MNTPLKENLKPCHIYFSAHFGCIRERSLILAKWYSLIIQPCKRLVQQWYKPGKCRKGNADSPYLSLYKPNKPSNLTLGVHLQDQTVQIIEHSCLTLTLNNTL